MMPVAAPVSLPLACHPGAPCAAVGGIAAEADRAANGGLWLAFALTGDLSALRIPGPRPARQADGLWRHTCFEAFVMAGEGPGYREFNFSPSGEWAVYAFRDYRQAGEAESGPAPVIAVRRTLNRLELDARIPRGFLPPGCSLRLGLSAVVEDAGGGLSYWALRHPPGRPDFHHRDAFALELAATWMRHTHIPEPGAWP